MTALGRPGGYAEPEMRDAVRRLCAAAGLDSDSAVLLRGQTNAVLRLAHHPVVIKVARRGTSAGRVRQTIALVQWLMAQDFPTVRLHPVAQPIIVDGYIGTFYTYLQQPRTGPKTSDLGAPLRRLHSVGLPPLSLPELDAVSAVQHSIEAAEALHDDDRRFLTKRVEQLASDLAVLRFELPRAVLHGDPQHGNALLDHHRTVLCDWDSAVIGPPEWDLVTVEIHARRFGHGTASYSAFTEAYGHDVVGWTGYRTLRDLRELRMITTNARKSGHDEYKMAEIRRRIGGLRQDDPDLRWHIM